MRHKIGLLCQWLSFFSWIHILNSIACKSSLSHELHTTLNNCSFHYRSRPTVIGYFKIQDGWWPPSQLIWYACQHRRDNYLADDTLGAKHQPCVIYKSYYMNSFSTEIPPIFFRAYIVTQTFKISRKKCCG